jgi:hypothetical protein
MIGRRAFAIGCLGNLALARPSFGQSPGSWTLRPIDHPDFNWRMVAQSDLVLRGILAASALRLDGARTISLPLAASRAYKGSAGRSAIELRYDRHAGCGPTPDALLALNARDAVFFLALGTGAAYHLVGCSPDSATIISAAYERGLQKEIDTQRSLVRRVLALLSDYRPPFEDTVTAMIRAALAGDNQSALRGLLRSGRAPAAAIIRHLDDRRPLPNRTVIATVGARPGQQEVGEVADLLLLALGIVAKDAELGWLAPDAAEKPRQRIVDAWYVWLGYSLGLEARG